MKPQINAVQESIKIALDAADAATDVTAEYKRIKNEYIKTEKKMKEIHKYTTIIFSSSIATAVVAILLTGLLYFKSLSELEEMTDTSREALVVFSSLSKHTDLLNANEDLKLKMSELSEAILNNDKKLMINLSQEISNLSNTLSKSLKSETDKIGRSIEESNIVALTKVNKEVNKIIDSAKKNNNEKLLKELSNSTSSLNAALDAISSQNKLLVKEIRDKKESITFP